MNVSFLSKLLSLLSSVSMPASCFHFSVQRFELIVGNMKQATHTSLNQELFTLWLV